MAYICRHIHTNGSRCGSPAMRSKAFCYWHHTVTRRHAPSRPQTADDTPLILHPLNPGRELQVVQPSPDPPSLNLPPLEDRESIQLAVSLVCTALARNELDPKRAALLLYGLQVASSNVRGLDIKPLLSRIVPETVLGPNGEDLAPEPDATEDVPSRKRPRAA